MLPFDAVKVVTAFCLGSLGLVTLGQTRQTTVPSPPKAAPSTQAVIHYGQLPLSFEPNRGQTSANVQWLSRGPEYTLFLAGDDAVLEMNKIVPADRGAHNPAELRASMSSSVLRMSLLGGRAAERTTAEEPQSGKANYFAGNDPAKWQQDVPMFGKVRMQGVYAGVDLVYYGHRGELEYDFVVAPGADASAIKLHFDGAEPKLAANGDLVLPVEGGPEVRFNKPVAYQMMDGVRQPVEGSFVIADSKAGGQIGFKLGAYDHSRELVIDPTLLFVGALGTGNFETQANGMAVDSTGEIILTGLTGDVNFPVTAGALQTVCNQYSAPFAANNFTRCGNELYNGSAFVTKISADGTSLVYSTYLHGLSGLESGQAVAADAAGDAIVLGQTGSDDFPVTADAYQSICMPYYYPIGVLGGNPSDFYQPAAEHCDGYFAGGGTEWVSGGPTLFIAKLNPTGSALIYSTFFGGTNPTYPTSLALDSSDNIYFTSYLQGAEATNNIYPQNGNIQFPVTANAFQSAPATNTPQAATLSELSADGHTLLYSTFIAATSPSNPAWVQPLSLAVAPNGIAYVGGWTYSDAFPTTPGSVRPACVDSSVYNGGNENGFCEGYTGWLAAFDTTQSGSASLMYGTYIGGPEIPTGNSAQNQVLGLAADSQNDIFVTGLTLSPNYPTTIGAYQTACVGTTVCNQTAFLTKIDPTGSKYLWSTYFGGIHGSSGGYGTAIGFDAKNDVYLFGYNSNYGFDLPLVNPIEPIPYGASYAFLATFSSDGSQLLFSTPLGSQLTTGANVYPVPNNGMALDGNGNIYFSAYGSDSGNFVTTPGTYATMVAGGGPRSYFGKISPVLAPSATTLSISPSTTTTGQTVTFTATVAGTLQSAPAPTGTVTLTNTSTSPATTLGTISLGSAGSGTFTTSGLAAGSYSVTASYSADSNYDVSTSAAMPLTITAPVMVLVPNVVGSAQSAATTSITGAGLVVGTVSTASSSAVPSGSVISESPLAGTSVALGSSVNLVISTGPATVSVPNVVGLSQSAATTSITGAGLVVGTVSTASSSAVPSGSVISESPLAGTSVALGSSVNLVISTGPATVSVPNVVGLSQSAATTSITGAGLVVGTVSTASSSAVPSGSVISESPLAGTSVALGSSVNLVISTGPATVSVPNVVGLSQSAATTSITGAGLVVGTVSTASSSTVLSGSVISEAPMAGTSVALGSSVNLVISTGPATVSVPNVVGLSQSAATTSITGVGLKVGTVTTASSSTVLSGSVISEAPLAGTSVAVGSSVNLVVSTGAVSTGNFTITPIPAAETVSRGVLGAFILELNSVKGFNGNVTLTCAGGPTGSTCTDFPMTVKLNSTAYAISGILFPKNSTPGTYTLTFTGVSGPLTNTATAKFTVK